MEGPLHMVQTRPTQPPTLSGTKNEYRPQWGGWQVKLCDPSLTRANISALEMSISHIIKCYTNVLFTSLYRQYNNHNRFNSCFPCKPGLASSHSVFLIHLFQTRTSVDKWQSTLWEWCPFCHPTNSIKVPKETWNTDLNHGKIVHWPYPFLIHHCVLDEKRGVTSSTTAVRSQDFNLVQITI